MEFTQETIDDLELIKLVEANKCLYAKNTREFKNVDKVEIWAQIGAILTKRRTGEQAQKRWESLRTMWSRQHKKYYEQGRSGSGASQDSQEFQYYGEMLFLIPHYTPRQTKSNMKRPSSSTPTSKSSGSSGFQPILINIPSSLSRTEECDSNTTQCNIREKDLSGNIDVHESMSSDDSCFLSLPVEWPVSQLIPQPVSQQSANEIHTSDTDDCVPLSPIARGVLKEVPSNNQTSSQQKFKRTNNNEKKVPEPDQFSKKKKTELDNFLNSSAMSMEKMVSRVEDVFARKYATQVSSNVVDKEASAMLECISVALKKVKPEKQLPCMIKILEVINLFCSEQ